MSAGLIHMRLVEVEAGANIILQVHMKGQSLDFPTVVSTTEKDHLLVEPVRIDGKIVGFSGDGVRLDLIYVRQDKPPFVWKNIRCTTIMSGGAAKYQVIAFSEGYEMNRREAFRLFLGINGIVQMGMNRKAMEVIVKDVSETGFSFVSTEDIEQVINMPVRLVFMDLNRNYSLMGIVVRKVVIAPNKILYGCHLTVKNRELSRYINEKQRQQMSINRDNAAFRKRELLQQSLREGANDIVRQPKTGADSPFKRNIEEVEKVERRKAFKENHAGKKV